MSSEPVHFAGSRSLSLLAPSSSCLEAASLWSLPPRSHCLLPIRGLISSVTLSYGHSDGISSQLAHSGWSPYFKILNLIISAKSHWRFNLWATREALFCHRRQQSRFPGIKTWIPLGIIIDLTMGAILNHTDPWRCITQPTFPLRERHHRWKSDSTYSESLSITRSRKKKKNPG